MEMELWSRELEMGMGMGMGKETGPTNTLSGGGFWPWDLKRYCTESTLGKRAGIQINMDGAVTGPGNY